MMASKVLFGKNSAVVRCFNFAALGLFMVCLLYSACMPDNIDLPYRLNSVTTKGATKITASGATLAGTVSTIDSEKITCGVIYGTTSSLSANSGTKKSATLSGNFSINISGLKANTTYYYRAYAVDADVYKYGEVRSFKTSQPNISVTTGSAANITDSSVMLYGTVNGADESLTCGIIYGTSSSLSSTSGTKKSTTSSDSYSISLNGLNANTTYYYCAYVLVNGSYKFGEIKSFKTKVSSNISAITGDATNITYSSATLSGTINGANQSLTCGIIYGTSSSLSSSNGTKKSTTSMGSYSLNVTGLSSNTTYYYRAYAVVDSEYVYGEVRSFTTASSVTVTSGDAIDLGLSVKWASCNVGAESPEEYGDYFAWGETSPKSDYGESNSVTYSLSFSELESRGILGSDGNLTAAYDAATANWGGTWRMPTLDEMKELVNECTWEFTAMNGVGGCKVTGSNGNSIFLPAAGYRLGTSLNVAGSNGCYWSATPYSSSSAAASSAGAYYLGFNSYYSDWLGYVRSYGQTVRPVSK